MNTIRLSLVSLGLAVAGCSFAARSPDMYRDDTRAVLDTKNDQIKTCYDEVLKTNKDAPPEVAQCVLNALQGLVLSPGDKSEGQATFVYEFSAGAAPAPEPAPAG
jgi:hypothetical protein